MLMADWWRRQLELVLAATADRRVPDEELLDISLVEHVMVEDLQAPPHTIVSASGRPGRDVVGDDRDDGA